MPELRTTGGKHLTFRYEPGDSLRRDGVQAAVLEITPEPREFTEDQARVLTTMYEEIVDVAELVTEPEATESEEVASIVEPEITASTAESEKPEENDNGRLPCPDCERDYASEDTLNRHRTASH